MIFTSDEHMNRFVNALESIGQIHEGVLEPAYASALYILTSDLPIWNKFQPYIHQDEIDIPTMIQEQDFSGDDEILTRLAGNLFGDYFESSPSELTRLSDENFKVALTAIELRRNETRVSDISKHGRPTKERERIIDLWQHTNMSQEAIARELEISRATVARHVRGIKRNQNVDRRNVSEETKEKIIELWQNRKTQEAIAQELALSLSTIKKYTKGVSQKKGGQKVKVGKV